MYYPDPFFFSEISKKEAIIIASIVIVVVSLIGYAFFHSVNCENKARYKFITPYGTQIVGNADMPYIDYDAHFKSGDTDVYVLNNKLYKLIQIK